MYTRILTALIVVSLNSRCQTKHVNEKYLTDFRKRFEILNRHTNWDVIVEDISEHSIDIHASTLIKDTLLTVKLFKYTEGNVTHLELDEIQKIFNRSWDWVDVQNYDQKMNLRYWYRFAKRNEGKTIFVVGKYNYLYLSGEFNKQQDLYFKNHSDSLTNVPGDSLPPLPDW